MNGYIAFWNNKRTEIYADSLYAAKVKAVAHFKPRKSQEHMVHVHLAETDCQPDGNGGYLPGKQVTHVAVD